MRYQDLIVEATELERSQQQTGASVVSFRVRVLQSPAGEMQLADAVRVRYDAAVMEAYLAQLGNFSLDRAGLASLGQLLANLLFPGQGNGGETDLRRLLLGSLNLLARADGLRIRLRLPAELAVLPWEYVHIGADDAPAGFLALNPRVAIVRHEAMAKPVQLPALPGRIRVLVALASPESMSTLDLGREQSVLTQALANQPGLVPQFIERATVDEVATALPGAGVFHFAGHGAFRAADPAAGIEEGGLIFLQNGEIGAQQLAVNLRGSDVRLAYLGACRSGQRTQESRWSGVATALVRAGIPAVVAYQFDIRDRAAIALSRNFYKALAAGMSIERALSAGRLAAYNEFPDGADWGVAVLYMRAADGELFQGAPGQVLGVEGGRLSRSILGDASAGVQVFVPNLASVDEELSAALAADARPYQYLAPFDLRRAALFAGREREAQELIDKLGTERLVVLHGVRGSGKTSFMAARVVPSLLRQGAAVITVRDYGQPLEQAIHDAFTANEQLPELTLPDNATLADLLAAFTARLQGTSVLVFDQFEEFLRGDLNSAARAHRINAVLESLKRVSPELLRVVLVVRDDWLVKLTDLQEALPGLLQCFIKLDLLDDEAATAAFEQPLQQVARPIYFEEDLLRQAIIPDLLALAGPDAPGRVHPTHLQIVFRYLYQAVCDLRPPLVTEAVYWQDLQRAEGILARFQHDILETRLADQRELAERTLNALAAYEPSDWATPAQLCIRGATVEELAAVLARLEEAELLVSRLSGDEVAYAFSSSALAADIRQRAGPEQLGRRTVRGEMGRVWDAWLARGALPGREQLRYLAQNQEFLGDASPEQLLLLLRGTVAQREPAGGWLEALRCPRAVEVIRGLEWQTLAVSGPAAPAARVLGIASGAAADSAPYGPLAAAAAAGEDATVRQTNALALCAADRHAALSRLEWATQGELSSLHARQRLAELRGALADADPEVAALNRQLPAQERSAAWFWRYRQRLWRDRYQILWLTVGAALGAGLGLGLLRGAIALGSNNFPAVQFAIYFWWAAILGSTIGLCVVLVSSAPGGWRDGQVAVARCGRWLTVTLAVAAVLFWLLHAVVTVFNGLMLADLMSSGLNIILILAVGAALGLAAYGHDRIDPSRGVARRVLHFGSLLRVLAVSLVVLAGQVMLYVAEPGTPRFPDALLAIGWATRHYKAELSKSTVGLCTLGNAPCALAERLALADAALTGLVIALGLVIGMEIAVALLRRKSASGSRSGEVER